MTLRIQAGALGLAVAAVLCPAIAAADCSGGSGCALNIDVPARPAHIVEAAIMSMASASAVMPLVDVGETLTRGEYPIIINAEYYGLPAVSGGWVYMRVGKDAYRVDWQSHKVLERVTDQAAANF